METTIINALLMGFICSQLAKMFCGWMDRGGIFDFVRIAIAKKYDVNFPEKTLEAGTYHEREHAYTLAFWEVAKKNKAFTVWLCPNCMSVRILVVALTVFCLMYGMDLLLIPLAFAANTFFLKY